MIDPANTSVVIIAHPDLRVAPDLLLWLLDNGFPRRNIIVTKGNDRDQCAAYNFAVESALTRKVDHCLFSDADVRPYERTAAMLAAPYDLTCAMCETEKGLESWSTPDAFHTALWVAKKAALQRIRAPWFQWHTNASGSKITGCVCGHLATKAKASGLTIGHAGHAHHWPRGAKLPDAIRLIETTGAIA